MSWNSSTRIERKRACSRSRSSGCARSRSRASSWRSSKSSADSRAFAWAYRSANASAAPAGARGHAPRPRRALPARPPRAPRSTPRHGRRGPGSRRGHQPVAAVRRVEQLEQLGCGPLLRLGRLGIRASEVAAARSSSTRSPSSGRAATARSSSRPAARSVSYTLVSIRRSTVAPVRGEQLEPLRIVPGAELRERLPERLRPQHRSLRLVELAETRVEPGCERIRPEEAGAEAVDRRDPGAVELAREVVPAALGERARGCGCAARRRRAACT